MITINRDAIVCNIQNTDRDQEDLTRPYFIKFENVISIFLKLVTLFIMDEFCKMTFL